MFVCRATIFEARHNDKVQAHAGVFQKMFRLEFEHI